MTETDPQLHELEQIIQYHFTDTSLLVKAMTHSSLTPAGFRSYERLEFLGDAVASLVVAQKLFEAPARHSEGEMTEIKSVAVSHRSMVRAGARLGLERFLRADRGLSQKQDYPPSLITDAYEAVIGAIFLDGGLEAARSFLLRTLGPELEAAEKREHTPNFKSIFQQLVQVDGRPPPQYRTTSQVGPEHDKRFQAEVCVDGEEKGSGWGRTKKDAQQKAAEQALDALYPGWREQEPGGAEDAQPDGQHH